MKNREIWKLLVCIALAMFLTPLFIKVVVITLLFLIGVTIGFCLYGLLKIVEIFLKNK